MFPTSADAQPLSALLLDVFKLGRRQTTCSLTPHCRCTPVVSEPRLATRHLDAQKANEFCSRMSVRTTARRGFITVPGHPRCTCQLGSNTPHLILTATNAVSKSGAEGWHSHFTNAENEWWQGTDQPGPGVESPARGLRAPRTFRALGTGVQAHPLTAAAQAVHSQAPPLSRKRPAHDEGLRP